MYCEFYQLSELPFNLTPDPKFLYLNARYREAIASLNYGITQRKGFISLIGEAGTGKTTLLKKLLEDLDPKTRTVFIFNTNVSFEEILEYIFAEFDLPVLNGRKLYMLQRLNAFLLEELRKGGNVALLIDEAQDLEFSVLEDLRLLSNLETAKEKILQIVLSGQPELGQKLSNPGLRQLRQRISINCRLPPLSRDEVTEYIRYRLEATHCPNLELFSREAENQIFRFSRGIPRLVNVVADNAMVIGYALGRKQIGADIIAEAAADLMPADPQLGDFREPPITVTPPPPIEAPPSSWRARLGVSAVVVVVALLGLLSVGRTMLSKRADEQPVGEGLSLPARFEVIRPGSQPRGMGVGYPAPAAVVAGAPPGVGDAGSTRPPAEPAAAETDRAMPAFASAEQRTGPAERRDWDAPQAGLPEPAVAPSQKSLPPPKQEVVPAKPQVAVARESSAAPRQQIAVVRQEVSAPKVGERVLPEAEAAVPKQPVAVAKQDAEPPSIAPASGHGSPRLEGAGFTPVVARVGDSISTIARREYGQASYTILDLLELANPELADLDTISAGQTIRLPSLSEGFPILVDGTGRYALLVFSTPQQSRATVLQAALRSHGFQAEVTAGSAGLSRPLYRVVVFGAAGRDGVVGIGKQVQKVFREDRRLAQLGE